MYKFDLFEEVLKVVCTTIISNLSVNPPLKYMIFTYNVRCLRRLERVFLVAIVFVKR